MAAVTLKTERPVLTVNIGGEREVGVPLTFTRAEFTELGKAATPEEGVFEFFRTYLGDVIDQIGDDDVTALIKAWGEARAEIGEPALGEPAASPQQ